MFREEVINVKLSDVLSEFGLNALPETIDMTKGTKKLPDVSILVEGVKVIIEGRKETYQQDRLLKDAKMRIEEDLADVSVALFYVRKIEESETIEELVKSLKNCQYNGTVFYRDDGNIKEEKFSNIPINELSQILHTVTNLIVSKEKLSEYVKNVQDEFANTSNTLASTNLFYNNERLLQIIKDLLETEDLSISKKQEKDLYQMLLFILFDAILMHETISNITSDIKGLSTASDSASLKDFFINEWEKILQIDYQPIFSLAYKVMENLPTSLEIENALGTLKQLATKVLSSGILRRHDFLGRLYHKILLKTTGSFYATYYTAIPSAILLSGLLLKTFKEDWKFGDLKDLDFKIIDPACGSGTLLSASYTTLMDLYSASLNPSEVSDFHKKIVEDSIFGWDVLDYASHLTLTTLIMHNPKTLVKKSNIYTLPNGMKDGRIYLGSLSYLIMDLFGKTWIQQGTDANRSVKIENVTNNTFDVVIMNPPFTRSANPNVRFGYSSDEVKASQDRELARIIKQYDLKGIGQAGLGALFIYLGHNLLKNNGRMGIVIPRAILSGVSWEKIRRLLMDNYEIKYIISNHDAGDRNNGIEPWNWSENTNLGEVMLIVEKNNKKLEKKEITYINLWNKPANEMESYLLVDQIIRNSQSLSDYLTDGIYKVLEISGKEIGSFYKIKQEELENYGWLAACMFANPSLNELAIKLAGWINKYSKKTLSHLTVSLGVDIKQIKDNFEDTTTLTKYKIVWGHQRTMNTMELNPNFVGYGRSKKKTSDSLFVSKSSDLLIAERPHMGNDCLLCMEAPENVLATAFWEIQLQEKKYKPIILLWFNSTYGILTLLSNSDSSMGEIFKLKKAQLEQLLIPLPDNKLLDNLENLYNQIKTKLFKPFPEEFMLAANGQGIRKMIDDFFRDNFKLPDLTPYYSMLAKEPMLTLKRL